MSETEIFIFGDTGGHYDQLIKSLTHIGVDVNNFVIPENMLIIHTGDLIHKGNKTDELVKFVNTLMAKNPTRWIQILGNHEYQHIAGLHFWRCDCSNETKKTIQKWGFSKLAKPSHALIVDNVTTNSREVDNFFETKTDVDDSQQSFLFTHAGLTRKYWAGHLNAATNVKTVSDKINALNFGVLLKAGVMLDVGGKDPGPVWALSTQEVWASWYDTTDVPFHQIFGHSPAYQWEWKRYWGTTPEIYRKNTNLDMVNRLCVAEVDNKIQICCDPGFSATAKVNRQPYLKIVGTIL